MKVNHFIFCFCVGINTLFSQGFTNVNDLLGIPLGYQNGEYAAGLSFVDFNQDGLDDLTIPTGEGELIHFLVNTNDGFELITPLINNTEEIKQVIWVDYDNDGDLDLYLASKVTNRLYKNTGDLTFLDITESCGFNDPPDLSFCGSWLDYDEDGLLDLIISHRNSYLVGFITLYRNIGNDQFQDVTETAGLSGLGNSVLAMATFDFNRDGLEDIYVGQDFEVGNLLLKNNGDGTFDNLSAESNSSIQNNTMTITIGDYNLDGWMDIYLTNTPEGNSFLENQGDGTFEEIAESKGLLLFDFTWGALFLDADNDMDLDLHIASTTKSYMFENRGNDLPFLDVTNNWGLGEEFNYSNGTAMGDYNNDGAVDFAENNSYLSPPSLWKNNFNSGNFLSIDLIGTTSNTMAVGAEIVVFTGEVQQIRRIGCGEGFSSQNSYTQFFGLGSNSIIDSISIKWTNGAVNAYFNVPVNQRITYTENFAESFGCTDPLACNYNVAATTDNGSCIYPQQFYDCNGNCLEDADGDGICDQLEIPGCTDTLACNFNPMATQNMWCEYPDIYYDCEGNCLSDTDMDGICDELEIIGCIDTLTCNFDPLATESSDSCSYAQLYYDCLGNCLNDQDNDGICDDLEIPGCMDSLACNYNLLATDDDGNCSFPEAYNISGEPEPQGFNPLQYTYPETIGSTYQWEITGGEIIDGQGTAIVEVIWNIEGEGWLSVTETNEAECVINSIIHVEVLIVNSEEIRKHNIRYYPNPVHDLLIIDIGDWANDLINLEMYDIKGKEVMSMEGVFREISMEMEFLSNGIYQVMIENGGQRVGFRIVVER